MQYPFSSSEHKDHQVHSSGVVAMKTSFDNYLFTAGEDGALFIFKITNVQQEPAKKLSVRNFVI
jgi:hypothetical protein